MPGGVSLTPSAAAKTKEAVLRVLSSGGDTAKSDGHNTAAAVLPFVDVVLTASSYDSGGTNQSSLSTSGGSVGFYSGMTVFPGTAAGTWITNQASVSFDGCLMNDQEVNFPASVGGTNALAQLPPGWNYSSQPCQGTNGAPVQVRVYVTASGQLGKFSAPPPIMGGC